MKAHLLYLLLLLGGHGSAQEGRRDLPRLLPERLRNLPTAISIYHSPTPVWPELNTDTVAYPGKYAWKHSTRVNTEIGELELIGAGSYIWGKNQSWIPNISLNKADFARYFNCPGGILKAGKFYLFVENYRHGDALYAGDALWFVLAKDKKGAIYKGVAIVETEGKLKPNNQ